MTDSLNNVYAAHVLHNLPPVNAIKPASSGWGVLDLRAFVKRCLDFSLKGELNVAFTLTLPNPLLGEQ